MKMIIKNHLDDDLTALTTAKLRKIVVACDEHLTSGDLYFDDEEYIDVDHLAEECENELKFRGESLPSGEE